jgi:hypothetical protein
VAVRSTVTTSFVLAILIQLAVVLTMVFVPVIVTCLPTLVYG